MVLSWDADIISLEEDDDIVNLLVYGPPGCGKTVLAGSDDRVLFLAPEDKGTLSAKLLGSKAKKLPVNNFKDLVKALDTLEDNIDEVREQFDWIAVDSLTHMQRTVMQQILSDANDENPDRDPDIPQIQDYQKYQAWFLRIVQAFCDLDINVIFTALVRTEEDEEGESFLLPDIQGKGYQMALTVASYMTSYGYMKNVSRTVKVNGEIKKDEDGEPVKKIVRQIVWRDTGAIRAKDRTNVLAPSTIDLTLKQIRQLISGEKTREEFRPVARKASAKKAPAKVAPQKIADAPQDPTLLRTENRRRS